MQLIRQVSFGLSHLFYPRICEGCRRPLIKNEETLCLYCIELLPKTNQYNIANNDTAIRLAGRFSFEHAVSFAYFSTEGLLQQLLHQLKYQSKKEIGIFLGKQFGYELKNCSWISDIDVIIPVPLYHKKELARGYNQSTVLAISMSEILNIPVLAHTVKRIRPTESQTTKTREERMTNVKDAFLVEKELKSVHVLLIDDVLTTGATLEACAQAILKSGNIKLSIATIGIAT